MDKWNISSELLTDACLRIKCNFGIPLGCQFLLYKSLLAFFILVYLSAADAKEEHAANVVGHSINVLSKELNKQQKLTVYLPESYNKSEKSYPVLYVVDGQRYFLQAIAYQHALLFQDKTPEFIVVGIETHPKERRELLGPQSEHFVRFIKGELLPTINKQYRTNNMAMYFGWEMAAGVALELLKAEPQLFNGYFLASATHFTPERLNALEDLLKNNAELLHAYLYFTLGSVETWSIQSHQLFAKLLDKYLKHDNNWHFELSQTDDHYTTPFTAFNKGLTFYFADYAPIRFYSIAEFNDFGGLDALERHYIKRGERYQIDTEIHQDSKHYLLNQAVKENDYKTFSELIAEFEAFIYDYYRRPFWFIRYGQFYVQHKNYDAALTLFRQGIINFPQSPELYLALGDLYTELNNKIKADENYAKAKEYTKDNANR